jgi:hypothetical protein
MQTSELNTEYGQMKTPVSLRVRVSRFLSDRYVQRERPSYLADLILWGLIIILASWPMFSLAAAMETLR